MGIINSISNITGTDKMRKKAYLMELNDDDSHNTDSFRPFQYYPETIHDNRGVNYTTKEFIGGSHPIYQWVHGSERTISFDCILTADYTKNGDNGLGTIVGVANVLKNPLSGAVRAIKNLFGGTDVNSLPIDQYIAWFRSKTYPKYNGTNPVSPPPKMLLWLDGSGIVSSIGGYLQDVIPVIMKSCNVTYNSFFRTGEPRMATVALEFAETIQIGDAWQSVNRTDVETFWKQSDNGGLPNISSESDVPVGGSDQIGFGFG